MKLDNRLKKIESKMNPKKERIIVLGDENGNYEWKPRYKDKEIILVSCTSGSLKEWAK